MTNFERIQEFHRAFNVLETTRMMTHDEATTLCVGLIEEELGELKDALKAEDRVKVFDGLCDLLYVTYGFGDKLGLPMDEGFREVHRSNMTKLGDDGRPVLRPDGKILKGHTYTPPDLAGLL